MVVSYVLIGLSMWILDAMGYDLGNGLGFGLLLTACWLSGGAIYVCEKLFRK